MIFGCLFLYLCIHLFLQINMLALRGGTTVKESVWRILSFLLSNDMARQINWRGINGKAAFKDTSLKTVINGMAF